MKVGDTVVFSRGFKIQSYNKVAQSFSIAVLNESGTTIGEYEVPMWLSTLGLSPPERDFVIPGEFLPKDHPDHYRTIDARKGTFEFGKGACKIELDPMFNTTGKYFIIPLGWEPPMSKIAQIRSEQLRTNVLNALNGQSFDGAILQGKIVLIYIKQKDDIRIVNYLSDGFETYLRSKSKVLIQDPITLVEYELPAEWVSVKP